MSVDAKRVQAIFVAAVEGADAAARDAILDRECAADAELRQRVEALLQAHQAPDSILDRPPPFEAIANTPSGTVALDPLSDQQAASMATPEQGSVTTDGGPKVLDEPRTDPSVTQADLSADVRRDLPFLTPSAKPGHLGRLGHYEILDAIGKGGFGIVLKGFDERLHRVVAIKVLSPAFAANGSARKRFIREARAAAAVKNEHVVGIYDVQENAEPPYLVMECIDGVSLQDKIDKHGSQGLKEILRIGMQIAAGLADAHKQGLVHRDIKPANILLENGVERVKITDFGLARAVDDASVTQSGTVAGTPMYMSPEQAEGLPIDHRSDLFSLGTVLYAMCTGHPPFRASGTHAVLKRVIDASPRPIREINSEIPDWLCDIIAKLHAKKAEDRFQTAKEVAELLGRHLAHLQQPSVAPRPARVTVPSASLDLDAGVRSISLALLAGFRAFCVYWVIGGMVFTFGFWAFGWSGPTVVRAAAPIFGILALCAGGLCVWARRWQRKVWSQGLAQGAIFFGTCAYSFGMLAFVIWLSPPPEPIPLSDLDPQLNDDEKLLQGVWILDSGVLAGKPVPEEEIRQWRAVITGRKIQTSDKLFTLETTFVVDSTRVPKTIRFADAFPTVFGTKTNEKANGRHGIFTVDQDTFTLCTGPLDEPPPTKFESPGGSAFGLYVRKREGKRTTPAGAKDGWVQLFNGKDLDGWVPVLKKKKLDLKDVFHINGNVLMVEGRKDSVFIRTEKAYENYELEFEFRVPPLQKQTAGCLVLLQLQPDHVFGNMVSIDPNGEGFLIGPDRKDFDFKIKGKPPRDGGWSHVHLTCRGHEIGIRLNGQDIGATQGKNSELHRGFIAILPEFNEVHYRNIRLRAEPLKKRVLRFDPARDTPIDRDAIEKTDDGWKIDFDKIGAYYTQRTFRFFELRDLELENCKVTLRGQMRTVALPNYDPIQASLQFHVLPQVLSEAKPFSFRSSEPKARGTTSWAPYEVSEVFHGRPVELAVTVNVAHRGEVFLKDLELVIEPLPEAQRRPAKDLNPAPAAPPKLVRRWTPGKDSFITLDGVSVDKAAWKVHHDLLYRDTLRLFELKDHQLGPGTFILKARLRSEIVLGYKLKANPFLEFRPDVATGAGPVKTVASWTATHRNENSAWYEARVRTTAAPQLIAVNLSFEGHGTLWIEEIEMLHIGEQK